MAFCDDRCKTVDGEIMVHCECDAEFDLEHQVVIKVEGDLVGIHTVYIDERTVDGEMKDEIDLYAVYMRREVFRELLRIGSRLIDEVRA